MKTGIFVIVVTLGLVGWVKGVVNLCNCDFKPSYEAEVVYAFGTVTGFGAVVGWMDFGE